MYYYSSGNPDLSPNRSAVNKYHRPHISPGFLKKLRKTDRLGQKANLKSRKKFKKLCLRANRIIRERERERGDGRKKGLIIGGSVVGGNGH
jgi:hypothetical protein